MQIPRFLRRVFKRSYAPSNDFWYSIPTAATHSGIRVSEQEALKYLTVYACVSLIAADLARLPLILYRRKGENGKERAVNHPLYDILHTAPNPETPSFMWRESCQSHLLLWGNTYSEIVRDGYGDIQGLWPLSNPGAVQVERNGKKGELVYKWRQDDGTQVVKTRKNMLHVPGFGFNGIYGQSMIALAREAVGLGLAAEEFGARFFGSGTHPSGVVEIEGGLGDAREEYIKGIRAGYAGLGKSHGLMVIEGGAKYKTITMPPEDAQFLETRDHQKTEICGMYHVPPHKIALHGQNSNYNNLEQENQSYVDSCLMHWVTRWESALNTQILTKEDRQSGLFFEFLVDGLLRGDSAARGEFYQKLFQVGSISPNEIRGKENMNPIEGGDQRFIQVNMVPLDSIEDYMSAKAIPVESQDVKQIEENKAKPRLIEQRKTPDNINRPLNRIKDYHLPLIEQVANRTVKIEAETIKRAAKKELGQRGEVQFKSFLRKFYKKHKINVQKAFEPALLLYIDAVHREAGRLMGADPSFFDDPETMATFQRYAYQLVERFVLEHCQSSERQILKILEETNADEVAEAIGLRMDQWVERRGKKIAADKTVRFLGAVMMQTGTMLGYKRKRWVTQGENCPFCNVLNGKIVGIEREYIKPGSVLYVDQGTGSESWYDPETGKYSGSLGDKPGSRENVISMKFYGTHMHPPIHQGCDCRIVVEK